MFDEPDDFDDDCEELDGPDSFEDERRDKRGTSECDGLCSPQCTWCFVAHACPDDCAGGECPYNALDNRTTTEEAPCPPNA